MDIATIPAASSASAAPLARGHGRTAAIGVVTLIYAAVFVLNVVLLLSPPRLSLSLTVHSSGQARVAWVLPGGLLWNRGMRVGDRVLAVDGHGVTRNDGGSQRVIDVVARTTNGVVRVDASALRRGQDTWPLLALSPLFFLFGTLIVLRAPRPNVGTAAYALFATAALGLALSPGADDDNPLMTAAELIVIPMFAFAFARFFLVFPVRRDLRGFHQLLVIPAVAAAALGLAALFLPSLLSAVSVLRIIVVPVYLAAGAGFLVWGFLDTRDRGLRQGLIILGAGAVVSLLPLALLSLAPRLVGWPSTIPPEEAALALMLLPASFAYATLRHDILRVPLMQRWLVYGLLWSGLLAFCVAVAYVLRSLPPVDLRAPDLWLTAFLLLAAGVAFRLLYSRLLSLLNRLIFKDTYEYRASLRRLSEDLSLAGDLDALGESLPQTLRALMNLRFVALLVYEGSTLRVRGVAGSSDPAMLRVLVHAASPADHELRFMAVTDNDHPAMLIPLNLHDAVVGYLCLGPRRNGEPFRVGDRDLLATLSGHLAALVSNAQLTDDLRLKVRTLDVLNDRLERTQEEERARLAADLHDEPLQTALYLDRRLRDTNGYDEGANSPAALSRTLANQLRAVSKAMRPAALDDLGLHAALDMLVSDMSARGDIPIAFQPDTPILPGTISSAAEMVLYRAAQEALNNALRHASPSRVRVSLRQLPDSVLLKVADDGQGFAVPDQLDRLVLDGHLGLASLRQRIEHAGGALTIESAPGEGTTVRVTLPVPARQP